MSKTLLKKYSSVRSTEVLHEAQFTAELGSCNSFTREAGKHTCTEYSAYHLEDFQGVGLRQKRGFGFASGMEGNSLALCRKFPFWEKSLV
jgi:hypothetical protein